VQRLLADTCELCGSQEKVEVHHIRALKDLKRRGRREKPEWMKRMAAGSGRRWSSAGNATTTFTPVVYNDTMTKDETLESRMN